MKTTKIELFSFEELSKEAQEKVINDNSLINVDFDWWNYTYEDSENIGLNNRINPTSIPVVLSASVNTSPKF